MVDSVWIGRSWSGCAGWCGTRRWRGGLYRVIGARGDQFDPGAAGEELDGVTGASVYWIGCACPTRPSANATPGASPTARSPAVLRRTELSTSGFVPHL